MSRELIVRPEAEADLADAFEWYDARRSGLGDEFLTEVDVILAQVVENPLRFSIVYQEVRRALLHRFPFKVFFYVDGDRAVVIAIVHVKRHQRVWQSRV